MNKMENIFETSKISEISWEGSITCKLYRLCIYNKNIYSYLYLMNNQWTNKIPFL